MHTKCRLFVKLLEDSTKFEYSTNTRRNYDKTKTGRHKTNPRTCRLQVKNKKRVLKPEIISKGVPFPQGVHDHNPGSPDVLGDGVNDPLPAILGWIPG